MTTLGYLHPTTETSIEYLLTSAWLIPIAMLGYLLVIVLDNLLIWRTNKTISNQTANKRGASIGHGGGPNDSEQVSLVKTGDSSVSEAV